MPAETWIDFEKDMLYLSFDLCLTALEHNDNKEFSMACWRFNTGRKEPYGYFYKELSHDIQKVKDLAISGIWNLGLDAPFRKLFEISAIANSFRNLESYIGGCSPCAGLYCRFGVCRYVTISF
jgi:hypothetical protein